MGIASFIETQKLKSMWKDIIKEINYISKKNKEYNEAKKILYIRYTGLRASKSKQSIDLSSHNLSDICRKQIALFKYAKGMIEQAKETINRTKYKYGVPGYLEDYLKITCNTMAFFENEINVLLNILEKEERHFDMDGKPEEFIKLFNMEREAYKKMFAECIKTADLLHRESNTIKYDFQNNISASDPTSVTLGASYIFLAGFLVLTLIQTLIGNSSLNNPGSSKETLFFLSGLFGTFIAGLSGGVFSVIRHNVRTQLEAQLHFTKDIRKRLV